MRSQSIDVPSHLQPPLDVACKVCRAAIGRPCRFLPAPGKSGARAVERDEMYHVSRRQASAAQAAARVFRPTPSCAPSRQQLEMSWHARMARPSARRRDRFETTVLRLAKQYVARVVELREAEGVGTVTP